MEDFRDQWGPLPSGRFQGSIGTTAKRKISGNIGDHCQMEDFRDQWGPLPNGRVQGSMGPTFALRTICNPPYPNTTIAHK